MSIGFLYEIEKLIYRFKYLEKYLNGSVYKEYKSVCEKSKEISMEKMVRVGEKYG